MLLLALGNLSSIDVLIVVVLLGVVLASALYSRRYTRSVADFLSANRCAGRYLLTVASGAAGIGAISIVAQWENAYQAGFASQFWGQMMAPIGLLLALSGWLIYRYRETRSLTLAQLMETRYSRRFRVFSGTLCWVSGVLNFGIFPAVTARFLIYFLGIPVLELEVLGLSFNITLGVVMAIELILAVLITLSGGQISVMITDFVQGQLSNIIFLVLLVTMLILFPWSVIIEALSQAPPGESKLNPFDISGLPDFNVSFFLMLIFISCYNFMVWQGSQGYNSSARTPHEAKMAGILAQLRTSVTFLLIPLAAICAYVMMHAPVYGEATAATLETLASVGDAQLAKQLTTTVALSEILPVGVMGLFAAVMIMAALSTDTTYLHSWGSIFVQDVLLPCRQLAGREGRISNELHLCWLRRSIVGVAAFAWVFSMLFPLKEFILMYFQATGAIFTGGAGAVLIGALYWKRGTTSGAWAAMITGSILAVGGIFIINILWPNVVPGLQAHSPEVAWIMALPEKFWLNGMEMAFLASLSAIAAYVIFSLLSPDPEIDMDVILHRGKYAEVSPHGSEPAKPQKTGLAAVGFTSEFTLGDKLIYCFNLGWVLFFFLAFIVISIWQLFYHWTDAWWANWWLFNVVVTGIVAAFTTIWFLLGGIKDMKALFCLLSSISRDKLDDGTVDEHFGDGS
ncbi:sodium:solute symporter [Ruficoccus amylovorans]|uniref:Sodium:solute symporter n=1 Tax=Ruficoccus amylovorans TaxID=1804625 RepID=A0A842H9N6_9BACT|nr:sodium:solute symporter [Ruficoccus amylovorans]MBC2592839.1 sodium:solute symporter [Ruficoccus amylovorans]